MENRLREEKAVTFLVELPKEPAGAREKHDFALEIDRFHELVDRITRQSPLALEFTVPYVGRDIHFYVTVSESAKKMAVRAMRETWESVRVREAGGAAGPELRGRYVTGGYVSLGESRGFPRVSLGDGRDFCSMLFSGLACAEKFGEESLVQALLPTAQGSHDAEANIRVAASSGSRLRAEEIFGEIAKGFLGSSGDRKWIRIARVRNAGEFIRNVLDRKFNPAERTPLSPSSLVRLIHAPHTLSERADVRLARSREFPLPSRMPVRGTLLGKGTYRGEEMPVRIPDFENVLIFGDANFDGMKVLSNLALADLQKGKRVVVLDLAGDLAPNIVSSRPQPRRSSDFWYVEADSPRPVGLNVVDAAYEQEIAKIIEYILPLEVQGPLVKRYLRNAIKLLAEDSDGKPANLLDLPRALVDKKYRAHKLRRSRNADLMRFWEEARGEEGGRILGKLVPYVLSAWREVVLKEHVRLTVGQARSSKGIADIFLNSSGTLVVNLKGAAVSSRQPSLGASGLRDVSLLAMLWLLNFKRAAAGRPFSLYVHSAGGSVLDFLALLYPSPEALQVRLVASLDLRAQLSRQAIKFISGCATHIILRLHEASAEQAASLFNSNLKAEDIRYLEPMHAYVRLRSAEQFFEMKLDAPAHERFKNISEAAENSQKSLGEDLLAVEKEVASHLCW